MSENRAEFPINQARELFAYISEKMASIKLFVSHIDKFNLSKKHKDAATLYVQESLKDTKYAFGSVQYYGGSIKYEQGFVRCVELRFLKNFFLEKDNAEITEHKLYDAIITPYQEHMVEQKPYMAIQFYKDDDDTRKIIDSVTTEIEKAFTVRFEDKYRKAAVYPIPSPVYLMPNLA